MNKPSTCRATFAAVIVSLLLAGCGGDTPEQLIASARDYLAKNDVKAAVIQLKTALQKADSAEARFLLGKALLAGGDPVAASVELRKASAQKHPDAAVVPLLARAMVEQRQDKALIEQYASIDLAEPAAVAELKTSLALAHARQGDRERSSAALQSALAAVPDHVPARLLQARWLVAERDIDGALALVDAALARAPNDHDAWQLKGDLLAHDKRDVAGAAQAYQKASTIDKASVGAHSGIVSLALARKDFDAAAQQVAEMKKVLAGHPQTQYLEAQLAFARGDYKAAKELAAQLLAKAPEHPHFLQLAGAAEFQTRSLLQAQALLQKALQVSPDLRPARLLLSQTYLRSGQPAKTLATLQPLLQRDGGDAEALSLAGEAHLQTGDVQKAEASFKQVAKLNPDDPKSRTALALVKLTKGDAGGAFGELEDIAAADRGSSVDLALISAHLRRGEFDAALKAIETLERKQPDKPLAAYLRGIARLGQRQLDAARQSFEQALKVDPVYFPALARLAQLDLANNKPEKAQQRFEQLLKTDPGNVDALLAMAQLRARAGASSDEVAALLANAVKLNPSVPAPRLQLIAHHIAAKRFDLAVAAAQEAVAAMPTNPQLLDALGQAQLASGDFHQAIASFNKLSALRPESPLGHLRSADAHLAAKDVDSARQSIERALAATPGSLEVQRRLVALELAAGRPAQALSVARDVQKQHPKSGAGRLLEGEVEASRGNWNEAAAAYRASLKQQEATLTATKLHAALARAGKQAEAASFAQKWSNDHPKDGVFLGYLGDVALAKQDYAPAEAKYLAVLKLQPDDARALNNVAWIKVKLNSPGALPYAEKANALRPRQPAVMDTLALALVADNRVDEALALLKQAIAIEPANHTVRLTLAQVLVKAGQKSLAKAELEQLRAVGEKFSGHREVAKLLETL